MCNVLRAGEQDTTCALTLSGVFICSDVSKMMNHYSALFSFLNKSLSCSSCPVCCANYNLHTLQESIYSCLHVCPFYICN